MKTFKRTLAILFILLLAGCGSRKAEVVKTEVETKIETTEVKTKIDTSNVEIKFNYELTEFTIQAKDNLKPFIYENKSYFNVVLKHSKIKDNTIYKKDTKVSEREEKQVKKVVNEKVKIKKVERKEGYFKYYLILLVLLIIYLAYRFRKLYFI